MVKHSIVPGLRSIENEAVAGSIQRHSNMEPNCSSGAVIVLVMVMLLVLSVVVHGRFGKISILDLHYESGSAA